MIDRRNLLLGSAPLALFLASAPSLAADPEAAQLLERVRALWREQARRAVAIRDDVLRAAGPAANVDDVDIVAEGLAWAAMVATCARERTRDLVHPAYQAALMEAAVAIGDTVSVLSRLLDALTTAGLDEPSFRQAHAAVTTTLLERTDDPQTAVLLHDASVRLDASLQREGTVGVIRRHRRTLRQLTDLAHGISGADTATLEATDPALLAEVAAGQARWGVTPLAAPLAGRGGRLGPGATIGVIALGLLCVAGVVAFALGIVGSLNCACYGVPIMLLGLTAIVLGIYGIHRVYNPPGNTVAALQDHQWVTPELPTSGWRTGRLWASGRAYDPGRGLRADPRGRQLTVAGPGAPSPQGRFGAFLGRVPGGPEGTFQVFYAMNVEILAAAVGGLELAMNVPPSAGRQDRGFRVHFRALD